MGTASSLHYAARTRGLSRTVLYRDQPSFGLLFVADRTIGVAEADVNRPEMVLLEKGRHRHPLGGPRRSARHVYKHSIQSTLEVPP